MLNYKDVIRELNKDRKWSNVRIAEKSGLTKNYISELLSEKKRPNPSFETLEAIAYAFGESVAIFSDKEHVQPTANPEWQEWIEMLLVILKSRHKAFKPAIESNLAAFSTSIVLEQENLKLKEEIRHLRESREFKIPPRKRRGSTA